MLRYSIISAFCTNASLRTAVVMAFQQQTWPVAHHKLVRIETVDAALAADNDILPPDMILHQGL